MASTASSVREAGVGELPQLSATLADAFATEPVTQWLLPGRRRNARLRRLFAIELEHYVLPAGAGGHDRRFPWREPGAAARRVTVPLSGAFDYLRVFGMQLHRASRLQRFLERNHPRERRCTSGSDSFTSASCRSRTGPGSGRCDSRR